MYQASLLERLQKYAAFAALKLPLPIIKWLNGGALSIDGKTMDPVVQFMVKYFVAPTKAEHLNAAYLRRNFDLQGSWFAHPPADGVEVSQWSFSHDNTQIACEIHRPSGASEPLPVLIFYHGGGYAAGSLNSHRSVCRQFAKSAHCAVIAVDYRLAPEHPFPTPINDCLAAYDAITQACEALGIDPLRVAIGGDSAGGNAAAVIAQQRRGARIPPKLQMLWVPWVDMSAQSHSYQSMSTGFFLDKITMEWYTDQYIAKKEERLQPLASPLLQPDFSGLCPAVIFVAGFDPLCEEGLAYAQKLKTAGTAVTLELIEGAVHPMINVAGKVPLAADAFARAVAHFQAHI